MINVVVYSKKNCPACDKLKGELTLNGVQFEVKMIDTDLDAMDFIAAQGHRSVPQVYVDGIHVQDTKSFFFDKAVKLA